MKSDLLEYDFVRKYGHLTWREAEWGLQKNLIDLGFLNAMAIDRASSESCRLGDLDILCGGDPASMMDALSNLASSEKCVAEEDIRSKWLRIVLAHLYFNRNQVADPLAEVESIYADFDYPEEMESFVRYMPAAEGYNPQEHTYQENIDRLYENWSKYLFGGKSSDGREFAF